jgi:hypothetical protein
MIAAIITALVLATNLVPAQQKAPTCEELRGYLQNGITVQQMIEGARQRRVPETVIRDYLKRCHLG